MRTYYPDKLKYTKTHVWVKLKGRIATIGITQYMLKRLGTLIYLDLPQVGDELLAGITFGEVESINAISDLTCPVEGTVIKDNKRLLEDLDILSNDPYGEGWLIKVRIANLKQLNSLMTAEEYKKYTENCAEQ
ncbi:MAG TPA: glycine cleavage system protein GcvH [Candidatus Brocadiia bacterium]|nr:glycine cleavage system protein GcvH [Planctomycetota bacterium]MBI4007643.1 glycine cleavage system protein GcvH [Planctomycetota bacterium]